MIDFLNPPPMGDYCPMCHAVSCLELEESEYGFKKYRCKGCGYTQTPISRG